MPLMYAVKGIGPKTDPRGTPLLTVITFDALLIITTVCALSSNPLSPQRGHLICRELSLNAEGVCEGLYRRLSKK